MTQSANRLRTFAIDFFTHFGADVYPDELDVLVALPPSLADTFGKPRLYLTFADEEAGADRELSPQQDLLSYGSRIFDRMMALLAGRGQQAQFSLPARRPLSLLPLLNPAAPPAAQNTIESQFETNDVPFFVFHFRASYVWTEKEEALLTVVVDAAGQLRPEKAEFLRNGSLPVADDAPGPLDSDALHRMFHCAQTEARRQVEARADALETDIRARLQTIAGRLTGFYRQLVAELEDDAGAADVRRELERDLQRKMADELERHQLRITLLPVSYAVARLPMAYYRWQLTAQSGQSAQLFLQRDLFSGQIEHFRCETCGRELDAIVAAADAPPDGLCRAACPLRQKSVGWAFWRLVGLPVKSADAPVSAGIRAARYQWRQMIMPGRTLFVGARPGLPVVRRFWPRVLIIEYPHKRIVWRQQWGRWRQISPKS